MLLLLLTLQWCGRWQRKDAALARGTQNPEKSKARVGGAQSGATEQQVKGDYANHKVRGGKLLCGG